MKIRLGMDGMDYASVLAVEEFGGPGFTWEIVTRDRRTSAVVATKRGAVRYKTKASATRVGEANLESYEPPERTSASRVNDLLMLLRKR